MFTMRVSLYTHKFFKGTVIRFTLVLYIYLLEIMDNEVGLWDRSNVTYAYKGGGG